MYALDFALNRRMEHSTRLKDVNEGENLYWSNDPKIKTHEKAQEVASRAWIIGEEPFYNGQPIGVGPKPPYEKQYGHYTQVR
jgi:hypothetical protein